MTLKQAKVALMWRDVEFNNASFDLLLAAYLIDSHYGEKNLNILFLNLIIMKLNMMNLFMVKVLKRTT